MPEFVHLHNHSEYSLLDGTVRFTDDKGKPAEFLKNMAAAKTSALAVTDHGNLYGAIEFYESCHDVGMKPIIGCEVYLAKGSRLDRSGTRRDNCHLTLLAQNYEGYQNLMALVSKAFLEGFYHDPRIDKKLLAEHANGLIALSGCLKSESSQSILSGDLGETAKILEEYRAILGPDNFYLEIMDHGLSKQRQVTQGLLELSKRTGIPLIATNDCHYFKKEDQEAQDVRVAIATGKLLEDPDRLRFESGEFYYKTPAEMTKLFSYAPEAIKNTLVIAEKCNLKIPTDQLLLPHYEVPAGFTPDSYLEKLCREGLQRKKLNDAVYESRLKFELSIIKKMGFSTYFLIVWDFIQHAKSQRIPVGPGRGSGAGSLVAYSLDITRVNPIHHNLLFERFLNLERRTMPDLDIDFSDEGREKVIEYVRQKYGAGNVAQIITFGSMHARLVIRDVGRTLGIPLPDVDRLAKLIPFGTTIHEALQSIAELKETAASNPRIQKLLALAQKLEGLKRHTGVHAAGTVITKEAVSKYSPLSKGSSSEVVTTQYNDEALLKLGLLKIDFLGLRTLTVIDHATQMIRATHQPTFDVDVINGEDAKAFQLLRSARTLGIFQLESSGMRDLLKRLKPTNFQDISAVLALYRPGPMQAGMLDDFVNRKHGAKKVEYEHPLLEPILQETYGTIVYQEQVMEIAKQLAGFTPGQADGLRKAMGKKIPEEMEKNRSAFVEGCKTKKIPLRLANKIFDHMVTFGGYGFNKSHTVAYATVAYQTAYLKANYPVEFLTALLTSEIGRSAIDAEDKENKLVTYLEEAKFLGIAIMPPDVQKSEGLFSVERSEAMASIRFGLLAIKNVGSGAVDSILQARRDNGPFSSRENFLMRVDLRQVNKKVLESLIKAGALDSLGTSPAQTGRAQLLNDLETLLHRHTRMKEEQKSGQGFLFESAETVGNGTANSSTPASSLSDTELLKFEREVLGFYLSGHPLQRWQVALRSVTTHTCSTLSRQVAGTVRVAGLLTSVRRLVTREKGEPWARSSLEDLTGTVNVLVFPKSYAAGLGKKLQAGHIIAVSGRLNERGREEGEAELIAEDILPIEEALARWARSLTLSISSGSLQEARLKNLKELLSKHPGSCPVFLEVHSPNQGKALVQTEERVKPSYALLEEIEKIGLGVTGFA
ncbi:MAG: DNA polymerase III subunit alpha [Elusimicrobia bacterium]|nr:DNA polymerase III subunit alpha [Elusimicrobiota bacterium]